MRIRSWRKVTLKSMKEEYLKKRQKDGKMQRVKEVKWN
jgi:hypothetical protein